MSKKTVECNVIVMDTSAEGVTPILVVVEGTDEKETSKEDVSLSQVTNEDGNDTHNANLSEFGLNFSIYLV